MNEVVELTVWLRIKGKGARKVLHSDTREIQDPKQRNRVIRKMLADADDKFSTKKRASRWKKDNAD